MALYVGLAFLQRAAGVILLPFVTRVMTPYEYGAASTVTATALLFSVVFGAALETAVFRWAARHDTNSSAILNVSQLYIYVVLPVGGLMLAATLWFTEMPIFGISSRVWAIEVVGSTLLPAATFFALPMLRASRQIGKITGITVVTLLSSLGFKLWLLASLEDKLLAWVLADLLTGLTTYAAALAIVRVEWAWNGRQSLRELTRFSVPLVPHRAGFWALSSLSRPALLLAGVSFGVVGLYAFASNVSLLVMTVLGEINRAVLPEYSRETFPAPTALTLDVARLQVYAALAVPAIAALLMAIVAPVLIGAEYLPALPALGLLFAGQVAYGLYLVSANYLIQAAARTSFSSVASLTGAAVILVGILMIGRGGDVLSFSAVTLAGFAAMAVLSFLTVRVSGLSVAWRRICPPISSMFLLVVGVALALAVLSSRSWLVALGLGIGAVAALALVLIRDRATLVAAGASAAVEESSGPIEKEGGIT